MPRKNNFQWNQNNEYDPDEFVSRTQRKRESTAHQELGEKLAALSESVQAGLPLSPDLRMALADWRTIRSHEGRRRHMQYVGRLMREENNMTQIAEALSTLENRHTSESVAFKHLETLRENLMLATPAELNTLLAPYGDAEKDLCKLVEGARNERDHGRPPHDFRALFRKLKELS